ncbi:MAG: hypothetical protein IIZ93_07615 [Acidaminococcaceae bacterium]|nr:hypothetical protein [Acidaminococcaceae bacterium]
MAYASNIEIFGQNYAIKDSRLTDFFLKTKKDLYFQNPRFLIFDFSDANRRSVKIRKGTYIDLPITSGGITTVRTLYADSDTAFDLSAKITAAATASSVRTGEENGKDFYVYLVPDGADGIDLTVSERKDYPGDIDAGYMADNTRRIGQFHTLCVDAGDSLTGEILCAKSSVAVSDSFLLKKYPEAESEFYNFYNKTISAVTTGTQADKLTVPHPLAGFKAGDILPESVFCLSFRPFSGAEGMVYDVDTDMCGDIYLQSGTGQLTASAYGATHTVSRQQQNHEDDMRQVGKMLIGDEEFSSMALGSNEKTTIQGASDKTTVGGHVDTNGRRMISFIGCEEMCGYLWQWTRDVSANGGSSFSTYDGDGFFGQTYGSANALFAGGGWNGGASCGSRSRQGDLARSSVSGTDHGGRGVARLISYI